MVLELLKQVYVNTKTSNKFFSFLIELVLKFFYWIQGPCSKLIDSNCIIVTPFNTAISDAYMKLVRLIIFIEIPLLSFSFFL